jgi:hypothetical protein
MSKKAKKAARELQRLQNLYQQANTSQPIGVPRPTVGPISRVGSTMAAPTHSHMYVKRDLLTLVILLMVMVAALIGLNLLAESTPFGDVLAKLVGKIF